ncbi:hypothetical protein SAMN05421780_10393 [Flexibacter flexilis DSM 6793]|uniref:7(1) septoil knot domain-containing protein n=1 Tax=Flexibacter flexilis DSM 6793 TaxID=927664 RepID=A0A1I1GTL7_9BACT|nr:DUF6150 family protein [Flexibacter flexilis]SFC15159.1 hypothetical protein SAMN05421780_10393 [Flexibacter flexilis DSM 6793]
MKYFLAFSLFLLSSVACMAQNNPNPCKVYGSVFIEKNRLMADYRIFVESSEGMADLTVFKTANKLFADDAGLWHFTDTKVQADFTVYIEPNRAMADFSVFYTETESFAGCK